MDIKATSPTPDIIVIPFSEEQVESLNAYQNSGVFHPFTHCNGTAILEARKDGWFCPSCQKMTNQNWAWRWMADNSWKSFQSLVDLFNPNLNPPTK